MDLYRLARPALFRLDPERAHELTLQGLRLASRSRLALRASGAFARGARDPSLRVEAFGLTFPNPVGLAAGLDKDGVAVPALAALGFGYLEVGTVTALAQPGNPRPRLFRLVEDEALINRMGFNNHGAERLAASVLRAKAAHGDWLPPVGVNVGKSRAVPAEEAPRDYERALHAVWEAADYLVLNVSSPNTPGLRGLQATGPLREVVRAARRVARERGEKPVLVKLAPDLDEEALVTAARAAEEEGAAGIVATNTTVSRPALRSPLAAEQGGLSGRPLAPLAEAALRALAAATRLPLVSVGGVWEAADVAARLAAGATLVQVYTAFVYQGPALPGRLCRGLLERRGRP
ncbi:MAG TPA: quinone-dependent dihydroorotate dehydrogenase [Trueperaceae bacterium]|nr:quinone-dependent dihydroorotate dehydrogenase [Trueperaceae bacterium]